MSEKNAYAQSGVDVEAGYEVVERIKKHVARTERAGVMGALGGFGGMFDLSQTGVKEPVLISGTDGVGTKLMLAIKYDKHDTIGQDCVAMCVNDIIAAGAEPLYFLDYVATGKNEPAKLEQVVAGVDQSGVTIHWVDSGVDTGQVIQQVHVPRLADDSLESFETRIHETEYQLYPAVLDSLGIKRK